MSVKMREDRLQMVEAVQMWKQMTVEERGVWNEKVNKPSEVNTDVDADVNEIPNEIPEVTESENQELNKDMDADVNEIPNEIPEVTESENQE